MMFDYFKTIIVLVLTATISAYAEQHVIHFENKCGSGTPTLVQNGKILSTGADYTANGPIINVIAYLQTGNCGLNGEGCTLVETTLRNPTSPGSGSGSDISLIPPHTFSVESGFRYYNGCDGVVLTCDNANCSTAYHSPNDGRVVSACQANDVNLAITFCH